MSNTINTLEQGSVNGLLDNHYVEPYIGHLRTAGYAMATLLNKGSIVTSFIQWSRNKQIAVAALSESHISEFVRRLPKRRESGEKHEQYIIRNFFGISDLAQKRIFLCHTLTNRLLENCSSVMRIICAMREASRNDQSKSTRQTFGDSSASSRQSTKSTL